MWKNKHVVIAMLVAPILAVIAWYGVDSIVAEQAQVATPGESYPMVARSNCRYDSGACDLVNNDFKLTLKPVDLSPNQTRISLESEFKIAEATLSLVNGSDEVLGSNASGDPLGTGAQITVTFPAFTDPAATIRVAVTVQQSIYYAEVPVVFMRTDENGLTR
jgi:hypothetical protein